MEHKDACIVCTVVYQHLAEAMLNSEACGLAVIELHLFEGISQLVN